MPRPKVCTARHGQHTLSNAKLVGSEQLLAILITPLPGGTVTNGTNITVLQGWGQVLAIPVSLSYPEERLLMAPISLSYKGDRYRPYQYHYPTKGVGWGWGGGQVLAKAISLSYQEERLLITPISLSYKGDRYWPYQYHCPTRKSRY